MEDNRKRLRHSSVAGRQLGRPVTALVVAGKPEAAIADIERSGVYAAKAQSW